MAAPRLPFLYPNLLRSVRSCEPKTHRSIRFPPPQSSRSSAPSSGPNRPFHTSRRYTQETSHQRYGPAAEPRLPPPPKPKDGTFPSPPPSAEQQVPRESEDQAVKEADKLEDANAQAAFDTAHKEGEVTIEEASLSNTEPALQEPLESASQDAETEAEEGKAGAEEEKDNAQPQPLDEAQNPLQRAFQMSGPQSTPTSDSVLVSTSSPKPENNKHPHLTPPPYVHHFDSYTLVKDLEKGGFSEQQSVIIMKAIRSLLLENLNLARQGLKSKSDIENETYLFRAACSELSNSVQAARNSEIQSQRSHRAQLQHEVDILSQQMTQEFSGLKDSLKGMFNDQKISTRELQRAIDTSTQELNYQISVSLGSDGKSHVEGLRWILTRRATLAIAISAVMIILTLRYQSYKKHKMEAEAKQAAAATPPPLPENTRGHAEPAQTARSESSVAESLG
ncbi:hypothetical protein AJ80_04897 [Polytolypa hystricis UAMH7299]|uniref:MOZ protein represents a chromatin-associated acetyltransferase n=1 Tax=Polytolypa hystricis (strain UAMH7299) TaxID=1447883 RepID=A0A2B7Y7P5_POLH7|nr:hypothetical protein AJ80_04897 [Polytolypa hystricis UAMH7299]